MVTKRELFEVEDAKLMIKKAITNLRKTVPGTVSGKVGKNQAMELFKEDFKKLLKEGYTTKQIAQAMKEDAFSILPKTITSILKEKPAEKRVKKTETKPKSTKTEDAKSTLPVPQKTTE